MPSAAIQEAIAHNANVPLLQLPAEIRIMIYRNLVATAGTVKCLSWRMTHGSPTRPNVYTADPMPSTQVLRVCQQLHSEAAPVLYFENEFMFTRTNQSEQFLQTIGSNRRFIRFLSIPLFDGVSSKPLFRLLSDCPNLRRLRVNNVHLMWEYEPDFLVSIAARYIMPWMHVTQQSRKDIFNALNLLSEPDDASEFTRKVFRLLIEELEPRVAKLGGNRNKRSAKARLNYGR